MIYKPKGFQSWARGNPVTLFLKHYDDSCTFNLSLPVIPRQYETFKFCFVKAKVGIDYFWVSKIEHDVQEDKTEIFIWLEAGFLNRYRQFALDKAIFLGMISSWSIYDKLSFEIDDELKGLHIHK